MFGQLIPTYAKKDYDLNGKEQFRIIAGKQYLYHRGFGRYIVRFDNDEVQFEESFFNEYFIAPQKKDW